MGACGSTASDHALVAARAEAVRELAVSHEAVVTSLVAELAKAKDDAESRVAASEAELERQHR